MKRLDISLRLYYNITKKNKDLFIVLEKFRHGRLFCGLKAVGKKSLKNTNKQVKKFYLEEIKYG